MNTPLYFLGLLSGMIGMASIAVFIRRTRAGDPVTWRTPTLGVVLTIVGLTLCNTATN